MYAKYTYSAGTTLANLIADVSALLTGTTDKTTLSASCNQANTEILTTYDVAGWTLHDNAAGTNKKVFSAPHVDQGFKYAILDFNNVGYLMLHCAEAWNATTHAGTNTQTTMTTSYSQRVNLTVGGVLYFSVSARRIVILSFQNGTWGEPNNSSYNMLGERQRGVMDWDTLASNYPLGFIFMVAAGFAGATSTTQLGTLPRYRSFGSNVDVTSYPITLQIPGLGLGQSIATGTPYPTTKVYNAAGIQSYIISPIQLVGSSGLFPGGDISATMDLYVFHRSQGAMFDEIEYNGKTRVLWLNSNTNTAGSLLVPKG